MSKGIPLLPLLLVAGWTSSPPLDNDSSQTSAGPSLTASPNPVPPGADPGTTIVIWRTGDGSTGEVYVSVDRAPEQLFAGASPEGSQEASWIRTGVLYEFRLYAGTAHEKLLAAITVVHRESAFNGKWAAVLASSILSVLGFYYAFKSDRARFTRPHRGQVGKDE